MSWRHRTCPRPPNEVVPRTMPYAAGEGMVPISTIARCHCGYTILFATYSLPISHPSGDNGHMRSRTAPQILPLEPRVLLAVDPNLQFILDQTNRHNLSHVLSDLAAPMVSLYSDYYSAG